MKKKTPETAPTSAWEAAERLAAAGKHVHHVSEGESVCVSQHCTQRIGR